MKRFLALLLAALMPLLTLAGCKKTEPELLAVPFGEYTEADYEPLPQQDAAWWWDHYIGNLISNIRGHYPSSSELVTRRVELNLLMQRAAAHGDAVKREADLEHSAAYVVPWCRAEELCPAALGRKDWGEFPAGRLPRQRGKSGAAACFYGGR